MKQESPNNSHPNKNALTWLSGAHFINDIYTGILNPIMPFVAAKIGISMGIATIILTVSHIFSSLLQPIFGFFADSIKKRSFIFWGLIMSASFIPLAVTSDNIWLLVILIALGSLGSSLFHPQSLGFTSFFARNLNTSKYMAIFIAAGTLGYSSGPVVSSAITQFFGMHKMPCVSAIGIIWAILMFKFVPKISVDQNINKPDFKTAFKRILSNRKLNILNIVAMLKTMVQSSCFILLPFLWKNFGHKPIYIGLALFGFIFAGGIGSLVSPIVEKKIGTQNVFYLSMIIPAPLMFLFLFLCDKYPITSLLIFITIGFIIMLATPVTMLMAQNVLPEYKSIISGFINGFSWGVIAIIMSMLGFAAEKLGIINVLSVVAVIPALCSAMTRELFKSDKI